MHGKTLMEYITKCPIKKATGVFNINANVAIQINSYTREVFEVMSQLTWYTRLIVDEFEKALTKSATLSRR